MNLENDAIFKMMQDLETLQVEVRRMAAQRPLFTVLNTALNETLTADQSNYDLGDYDFIVLGPNANRTIYGIANGVRGRFLIVKNSSSSFTISFPHQSGTASLGNRIVTATLGTIVLGVRQTALFQYISDPLFSGTNLWLLLIPGA